MNYELMVIAAKYECRNVEPRILSMIRMEALVYAYTRIRVYMPLCTGKRRSRTVFWGRGAFQILSLRVYNMQISRPRLLVVHSVYRPR